MTRKEQLLKAFSLRGNEVPAKSNMVAQLLTEADYGLVSGGEGYSMNGSYTQTSGNFTQAGGGGHSQTGGGDYTMGTKIEK